ncbi:MULTISPECIES: SwmB domain-containing protein [Methylosinus]|nr:MULTISPECIES: SwmB domain-containing protein [Methylosinus]OBS50632.1 hypothetical protein A8B73_20560 [Methylosinus sp. 3S-1]
MAISSQDTGSISSILGEDPISVITDGATVTIRIDRSLFKAAADTLGLVMVGTGLAISADGKLSVSRDILDRLAALEGPGAVIGAVIASSAPDAIVLTHNSALSATAPAPSAFTVAASGGAVAVSSVSILGAAVTLGLSRAIGVGETVSVSYAVPETHPLSTVAGLVVAAFSRAVINNVGSTPSSALSTVVTPDAHPSTIILTYSAALAAIVPATSAFTVTASGGAASVVSVDVSGNAVTLGLSRAIVHGETLTASYVVPQTGALADANGIAVAAFTDQPVTNEVGDPTALSSLPAGAVALWLAENYSATPQPHIPNYYQSSVPVSQNLVRGLDDPALRPSFWGGSSIVVTYNQPGPDDSTTAVRIVGTNTTSWYYDYTLSTTLPAGEYTIGFSYKRGGAADQTFKTAFGPTSETTFTATDTWQTASFQVTLASTSAKLILAQNVASVGADILIDHIRIYAGATDYGADHRNGGHLLFGRSPNDGSHIVTSGVLDLSSGAGCLAVFDEDIDLASATVVAVGTKIGAGNGSGYHAIVSKTTSYSQFSAFFERELIGVSKLNNGTYERPSLGYFETYIPGYHFWAHRISSLSADFFFDDSHFQQGAGGSGAVVRSLFAGAIVHFAQGGDYICNFKTTAIGIWPRALSNEEIATARSILMARAANVGAASGAGNDRFLVVEGDSLSLQGPGDQPSLALGSYWYRFAASQNPKNIGWIGAIGGSTVATLAARKQAVLDAIPSALGARKFIFSSWIGVNGLANHPGGVTGWLADYAAYLDEIRARGAKVVVLTITPYSLARGGATFDPIRLQANAALRGWVGTHCDAIVDVGGDATIGVASAAENTAYYYDGLHMTDAAYAIVEPLYRAVVNAI